MNILLEIIPSHSYADSDLFISETELDSNNKVIKKVKYFGIDTTVI